MIGLVYGVDDAVKGFVARRIGLNAHNDPWPDGRAIGVARNGRLIGGAVFSGFHAMPFGNDIMLHGAFDDVRWASRGRIGAILAYPFHQLGCIRLTTVTARGNRRARAFDERLGFRYVGKLRRGWDGRRDAVIYDMLREDCRWLRYAPAPGGHPATL